MSRFKTSDGGALYRSFSGSLRLLQSGDDYITEVSLDLLNDRVNRNNWKYLNLERHLGQFLRKPVLTVLARDGVPRDAGHNFVMRRDPQTGEEYADFSDRDAERMVGVSAFEESDVRLEKRGEDTWVTARGVIYSWYARQLTKTLDSQGGQLSVSIETLIKNMHMEGDTEVYDDWIVLGVTVLGASVPPAVAGANVRTLSEASEEIEKIKLRVASYRSQDTKPQNTSKEKGVKTNMSKSLLAQMQERFPDYRVIAANGLNVCLLSNKTGEAATYQFTGKEDMARGVVPERITPVEVMCSYTFDEGAEIRVDMSEIMDSLNAQIVAANSKADTLETALNEAQAKIQEMQDKEHNRRVQTVKEALKNKLNEITAADADAVDNACYEDLCNRAEDYAGCEDDEGNFTGDAKACTDFGSACMNKLLEKRKADNAAREKVFTWESVKKNSAAADGIEGILSRINND